MKPFDQLSYHNDRPQGEPPTRRTISSLRTQGDLLAECTRLHDALETLVLSLDTMLSPRSPLSKGATGEMVRGFIADDLEAARVLLNGERPQPEGGGNDNG